MLGVRYIYFGYLTLSAMSGLTSRSVAVNRTMAVISIVQLYECALDGLSYDNRDDMTAHMNLQHGIERFESSLVRERRFAQADGDGIEISRA